MTIGTKSILFGAHQFLIHPFFVAWAWCKLYSFPWDPRLWLCFFIHDIGYLGKPNLDGHLGERHVLLGAEICSRLLDWSYRPFHSWSRDDDPNSWWNLCMLHSRYWAKMRHQPVSKLCYADKLAFLLEPKWLYLPRVWLIGEWKEYMGFRDQFYVDPKHGDIHVWYSEARRLTTDWLDRGQHLDKTDKTGMVDTGGVFYED